VRMHRFAVCSVLLALACLFSPGCAEFGQVNQGQVVEFDAAAGRVVLIADSNYMDPRNPRFDVLPPLTVRIPADPSEMGPAPLAGRLLSVDAGTRQAVVYDPAAAAFRTIPIHPIEQFDGVPPTDPRVARRSFPVIDRGAKTIQVYWQGRRRLVKFSVSEEHFNLPEDTWAFGDEVRYYFKDPAQALRMMNVTRTDITSGK